MWFSPSCSGIASSLLPIETNKRGMAESTTEHGMKKKKRKNKRHPRHGDLEEGDEWDEEGPSCCEDHQGGENSSSMLDLQGENADSIVVGGPPILRHSSMEKEEASRPILRSHHHHHHHHHHSHR